MKSKSKNSSYVKKAKLILLFLGVLSVSVAVSNQPYNPVSLKIQDGDWIKYFSKPGFVEIYFPTIFESNFQATNEGKITTVTAKDGGAEYLLKWTILPDNSTSNYAGAKTAMLKFKDSYKGEVKEEDKFKMKKTEGAEAMILIPEKNLTVNYKVIIVNSIMYEVAVFSPTAAINKKNVNKFLKSFEITD